MTSNERVHAHLDGELPADALSAEERARAAALAAVAERAAAHLRAAPVPDLVARVVMALPGGLAAAPVAAIPAAPDPPAPPVIEPPCAPM